MPNQRQIKIRAAQKERENIKKFLPKDVCVVFEVGTDKFMGVFYFEHDADRFVQTELLPSENLYYIKGFEIK
jgi:hypothetical protein